MPTGATSPRSATNKLPPIVIDLDDPAVKAAWEKCARPMVRPTEAELSEAEKQVAEFLKRQGKF